jgi:uncharacterized membrane protein YfcA
VNLSGLDYLAAAGAAAVAGAVNALAGGGTLISFPTLVAIGVPAVPANVTNTVSLVPGYLGGAWAQRDDLRPQMRRGRPLLVAATLGGIAGSVLLVSIPSHAFKVAVPYLILVSCALLLFQDRIRDWLRPPGSDLAAAGDPPATGDPAGGAATPASPAAAGDPASVAASAPSAAGRPADEQSAHWRVALLLSVFASAVYGGFFGAGLGIMLLAVLGLFSAEPLVKVNALKQALSFVVNLAAAVFFAFSGQVVWELVPVMAAASIVGGVAGGRLVQVIDAGVLRAVVIVIGVAVAIAFWAA